MSTRRPVSWLPLTVLVALVLSGCSDDPTSPAPIIKPSFATDAYCALYPHLCSPSEPDEEPSAPGYYGGPITDKYCAGQSGGINDADEDLLADECELWLAIRFAPKMVYDRADDVRRESYWAAKPVKVGLVRVFYALGYYFDLGTTADCIILSACNGHSGDSEYIYLDLRYNPTAKHWYLVGGRLSVHTTYITLTPGSAGYPTSVAYPNVLGGYPQIFVARQKHANYPSRALCNSGSFLSTDDCSSNDQSFRPEVLTHRNLGSSWHRLVNKVASTYSFYQNPVRYEYMWTSLYFYGWQLDHTTHAKGYGEILRPLGF